MRKKVITTFLIISLCIVFIGCSNKADNSSEKNMEEEYSIKISDPKFSQYQEMSLNVNPAVDPYMIEPDFSNIENAEMFNLSSKAEKMLVENGFVVIPDNNREFFPIYEMNRYQPVPSFVTTDSMLHNYHLFFDHLLRVVEKEKLLNLMNQLTKDMLNESMKQYEFLKDTNWENAAKRNIGFFAVAGKLLDSEMTIPEVVKAEVKQELELIKEHQGIVPSPLINMGSAGGAAEAFKEDYSQYIPRGHYDTDDLRQYFKAAMWFGRISFRLKSEDETRSAVLITMALNKENNLQKWEDIYEPTKFFVGKSDDISYNQYIKLLDEVYNSDIKLEELISNQEKWNEFITKAGELESPRINSIPIFDESINPDREKEIKGFRFLGQRFTLDASIFQRLIYREVGDMENKRMLPKGLDIPTAFGSEEAYSILESMGETKYKNYSENMSKLRNFVSDLEKEKWTQNLYWSWLYTLKSLIGERGEGYPTFMCNFSWTRKELNTFLSSWTELKHDTILYAKQVYAEMGGGDIGDDRGYVEPNPELYSRLTSLVRMTREGLSQRQLLNEQDEESLKRLEQLAESLKIISEKELSNIPLTDEEYELIRSYGGQLEHFWLEALSDEGIDHRSALGDRPAALVADVATNPEGLVLEEATGHIFEIYAVVPVDGNLRIARGGVYSYYEFPWPIGDRLTDKKWHKILDEGERPELPAWTKTFIVDENE